MTEKRSKFATLTPSKNKTKDKKDNFKDMTKLPVDDAQKSMEKDPVKDKLSDRTAASSGILRFGAKLRASQKSEPGDPEPPTSPKSEGELSPSSPRANKEEAKPQPNLTSENSRVYRKRGAPRVSSVDPSSKPPDHISLVSQSELKLSPRNDRFTESDKEIENDDPVKQKLIRLAKLHLENKALIAAEKKKLNLSDHQALKSLLPSEVAFREKLLANQRVNEEKTLESQEKIKELEAEFTQLKSEKITLTKKLAAVEHHNNLHHTQVSALNLVAKWATKQLGMKRYIVESLENDIDHRFRVSFELLLEYGST